MDSLQNKIDMLEAEFEIIYDKIENCTRGESVFCQYHKKYYDLEDKEYDLWNSLSDDERARVKNNNTVVFANLGY